MRRWNNQKDANHALITEAIEKAGGCFLDLSNMGHGVPDLIVNTKVDIVVFAEIKNPQNTYGRRGLNDLQRKWASQWRGTPVFILRTIENAIHLVQGKFGLLQSYGGCVTYRDGKWQDVKRLPVPTLEEILADRAEP